MFVSANCLAKKITRAVFPAAASEISSDLSSVEYGWLIEHLVSELSSKGGVILHDVQELNGDLALALHVICDRETPVVANSMVTLTLKADTDPGLDGQQLSELVFEELTKRWEGSIHLDKLPALLTRISSKVLRVQGQTKFPDIC